MADSVERVAEAVPIKLGKAGFGEAKLFFRDQGGGRDAVHAEKIARWGRGVHLGAVWCAVAHPMGVGVNPDLPVISAKAGIHVGALETGSPLSRG